MGLHSVIKKYAFRFNKKTFGAKRFWGITLSLVTCLAAEGQAHGIPGQFVVVVGTAILSPVIIPLLWLTLKRFTAVRRPVLVASLCHFLAGVWVLEAVNIIPEGFLWKDSFKHFLLSDFLYPCLLFSLVAFGINKIIKSPEPFGVKILWGTLSPIVVLWLYIRFSSFFHYNEKLLYQPVALSAVYIGIILSPVCFAVSRKWPMIKNRILLFILTGLVMLSISQVTFPYFGSMILAKDLLSRDEYIVSNTAGMQQFARNSFSTRLMIGALENEYPYVRNSIRYSLIKMGAPAVPALIRCLVETKQLSHIVPIGIKADSFGTPRQYEDPRMAYFIEIRIDECRKTLRAITGNDFGKENSAWIKWWANHQENLNNSVKTQLP